MTKHETEKRSSQSINLDRNLTLARISELASSCAWWMTSAANNSRPSSHDVRSPSLRFLRVPFKYDKELAARGEIEFVGSGRLTGRDMGPLCSRIGVVFDWEIAMLIQPSTSFAGDDHNDAGTMRGVRFLAK